MLTVMTAYPPSRLRRALARRSDAAELTVNSVNSPTSLATLIVAAVLLGDDFVADRQPEPGAFAGRLGGEERLEQLVLDLGGNADAVVAHAHLDGRRRDRAWSLSAPD